MMSANVTIIGELTSPTTVETVPTVSALLSWRGLILLIRRELSTSMLSVLVVESATETSESALASMDMRGKACHRTTCPNACSGHGTCEYIEDISFGATWNDYTAVDFQDDSKTFAYAQWDNRKTRGCVCDATYG
jgi:hypothetical protein